MPEPIALIPAAGKGTRAYPYTSTIPKCMLNVLGRPLLAHTIERLRDQLGIRRVVVVVGDLGGVIQAHFGDGARWGVQIEYVRNQAVERGLAYSVSLGARAIAGPILLTLSDEYYQESNLGQMPLELGEGELGRLAFLPGQPAGALRRNYTALMEGDRLLRLMEKPRVDRAGPLGTGTMLLAPHVRDLLEAALEREAAPDFIEVLDQALQAGAVLRPFYLEGGYVNVNDVDSLNWANYLAKRRHFPGASLSVVIQSVGGEEDLDRLAAAFEEMERVDEVLLVAPWGTPRPAWADDLAKLRWVEAPPGQSGYGAQIDLGLGLARGDLLAVVEGFSSFRPGDLEKLLAYVADADMVLGTRTTRQLIAQGSRMRGVVRLAHILLAKLVELLWLGHRVRLTDVGCTFRIIWRHCFESIRPRLTSPGPAYVLEMTLETLRSRQRIIEIPVSFLATNQELARRHQNLAVFMAMLRCILRTRLRP